MRIGIGIGLTLTRGRGDPLATYALADDFDRSAYRQSATNAAASGTTHAAVSSLAGYTFTASGEVYEVNSDGTIAGPFAANVPAIADNGFRARQALTNLLLHSQAFDNASWTKEGAPVVTANAGYAPDGTLTADEVNFPSSGIIYQHGTIVASSTSTQFVFAKKAPSGSAVAIRVTTNDGAAWGTGLSTKLVLTEEWQMVRLTGALLNASTTNRVNIGTRLADNTVDPDCVGNVLLWQAQLINANLPDGGPIIPTTTASATRGDALLTHNLFADGSALTDQDMLIWVKGTPGEHAEFQRMVLVHDGTANNFVELTLDGVPGIRAQYVNAGVVVADALTTGSLIGKVVTAFLRRSAGQWRAGYYVDGVLTWFAVARTLALPSLTKATVGNYLSGAAPFRGTIDSAFIDYGTFDTDAKVIAAITGTP